MLPIADYDYHLPPELIAQTPIEPRDHARLLVVPRAGGPLAHSRFDAIIELLRPGDVLVANNSRVIPARLYGRKTSGGKTEALLLNQIDATTWEALMKGKMRPGTRIIFSPGGHEGTQPQLEAEVVEVRESGARLLSFPQPVEALLGALGAMPLPPYITAPLTNPERYQTVYSAEAGSAAAPTAGLHWTPELIARAKDHGVTWAEVTLHVGLDTFRPVQVENALEHAMHREWYTFGPEAAAAINAAKARGGRVIAIGTTSVRVLETVGRNQGQGPLQPESGWTDIFIYPPHEFRVVDGLITNFHLPRSTLLLLVSALVGRERLLAAYAEAIAERYRFFSFGDAMAIL